MIKKRVLIVLTSLICIFALGCSKIENPSDKEGFNGISSEDKIDKDNDIKISTEDSLNEVKNKIYNACIYDSQDKAIKTIEEAKEYVKEILPDGINEIESKYDEHKGVTYAKYGTKDFVFYVGYIHPYHGLDDSNDLDSVSGITFPRVEINANWESSDVNKNK